MFRCSRRVLFKNTSCLLLFSLSILVKYCFFEVCRMFFVDHVLHNLSLSDNPVIAECYSRFKQFRLLFADSM